MCSSKVHRARPTRGPAPALPSFAVLDETHRQVLLTLKRLTGLVNQLDTAGMDDAARAAAQDICSFFNATARAHHAAEEQLVFPSLLRGDDLTLIGHVHRLQQDHGWLEEDWLELEPQLSAIAAGYSWYDMDVVRSAIPIFVDLYRDHIALEESIVYPASRVKQD